MMEESLTGGLRLQGLSPVKAPGLPVISIITIVYNGLNLIEKTIRSIIAQTYPNIEFIVIDGNSSDGTVEIIRLNEEHISYWISEPDGGIYDAMNKGLAAATGDFVWFMNAGDQIYTSETAEKIFSGYQDGLIYYGDTMVVDEKYHEVGLRRLRPPEKLSWKSFKQGMLVCHQAILVSRLIAEPFDPQYKHSADFDWVVKALKKAEGRGQRAEGKKQELSSQAHQHISTSTNQPIINTHLVLCAFLDGGHSKQNIGISLRERFHSMVHHYGLIPATLRHIPIVVRFGWYVLKNQRF
jgi:glycosyltransferase involved in cell wall biosynthesis